MRALILLCLCLAASALANDQSTVNPNTLIFFVFSIIGPHLNFGVSESFQKANVFIVGAGLPGPTSSTWSSAVVSPADCPAQDESG